MGLTVGVAHPALLDQSAPVQQNNISGVISATPGSNGFATLSQPSASTPSSGGGGGGYGSGGGTTTTSSTPAYTPVSQETIDAIMTSIANHIAQNQYDFNTAQAANAADDVTNQNTYTHQVQGNTENRATAVQNAETAAAQGNQGLKAVLASLGALNGTGQILAGRAVANAANSDIGGADQTFQTNANSIAEAKGAYDNSKADRDNALHSALTSDNQNVRATGIQDILNDAKSQGDTATYNKFLPQLVQATAPSTPIAATHTVYSPASVNAFAPTSGLRVTSAPVQSSPASTTPVNSALFVKKDSTS